MALTFFMKSSQPVLYKKSVFRWTALLIIAGGILMGIIISWFGVTSWRAYVDTFIPTPDLDLSTLKPSHQPLYLETPNNSTVTTSVGVKRMQEELSQTGLDDTSRETLTNFGISPESWMRNIDLFTAPGNPRDGMSYLMIRGDIPHLETDDWNMERVMITRVSQNSRGFKDILFNGEINPCSSVHATGTKDYFMMAKMDSPCEAFSESTDTYYDWFGNRLVSIEHNSRASNFSFGADNGSGDVSLTFSKKCSSEGVPYDQIWDKNEEHVLLKTSITGLVISNIFHQLPTPVEVSCGEFYGGNIVDPMIGAPSFDGRFITFDLTNVDSPMLAKIDITTPEKVTFESK